MFEQIRADKDFNLETLTYQEIFDGIKVGIAKAIAKEKKEEVEVETLILNVQRCRTKLAYVDDMNLYPKIYLDLVGDCSVVLTPFDIRLLIVSNCVKTYSCEELSECFYNFMCERFPNCDYENIYEKYLINAEKIQKQREKQLFL